MFLVGISNILYAELLGLRYNLKLARELGHMDMNCYSNSKGVIKLVLDKVNEWHHYATIILNIKDLLAREWRVHLLHNLRERNACADYFAKLCAKSYLAWFIFLEPHDGFC